MVSMQEITESGSRYDKLKNLALMLATAIDDCEDSKSMAQLSRQYRETLRELDELIKEGETDDEIGNILSGRIANGKAGAIRKNSSAV